MNTLKDDAIDIEIPDDELAPAADIVIEEPAAEPKPEAPSVDESIEELKASVARETQRANAAEQRANEATHIAVARTNETAESNLNLVTNAIGTLKSAQETLKGGYSQAMANQDYDGAAEIQVQIADNAAKLQQLEQGEAQMKATPKVEMPQRGDPVEEVASRLAQSGAPKSAAWVRAHPDYIHDPRLNARMVAAGNFAATDHPVDSDAYIEAVERTLGLRQEQETVLSDAAQPAQRRNAPPAAPVSRSGSGAGGSNPNRVTLSAEEREMAALTGQTDEEFARNKLALIKEGKLTRH